MLSPVGKVVVNHIKMIFWDLGGQVGLRVIWDKYYSESHAVIYVVDSADYKRMEEVQVEIGNNNTDRNYHERNSFAYIIYSV